MPALDLIEEKGAGPHRREAGRGAAAAHRVLRAAIPHLARDRYVACDLEAAERTLADGTPLQTVEAALGPLASS
jgi:histidine ammonia-lyase